VPAYPKTSVGAPIRRLIPVVKSELVFLHMFDGSVSLLSLRSLALPADADSGLAARLLTLPPAQRLGSSGLLGYQSYGGLGSNVSIVLFAIRHTSDQTEFSTCRRARASDLHD